MKLSDEEALARLTADDHGVLCTLHTERGIDAVPVVYAMDSDGYIGVPVDRVKPKASLRLQREQNLEADPRATLLIEQWDRNDWSQLWWVRAQLQWQGPDNAEREQSLANALAPRFHQYQDHPFEQVLVLRVIAISGWAASSL
jgi:Pyridoxamine 5'-phosphate oxidase